jgi:hypothetical protein
MRGFREHLIRIKETINGRWMRARRWLQRRPTPASTVIVSDDGSQLFQPLDFNEHVRLIRNILKTLPGSSPEAVSAIKDLRACFAKPPAEIVTGEIWGVESDFLVVKTHLKSEFDDAVDRLMTHGKVMSADDRYYLRSILSHSCGWSPTATEHSQDPWMRYLQAEYAHLVNLQPILDSFTWQEELRALPDGWDPPGPWLFLLETSNSFYVYDFENRCMCLAGSSLKEVYIGLKEARYRGDKDGDWDEESCSLDINPINYFPVYNRSREGELILEFPLKEFDERIVK